MANADTMMQMAPQMQHDPIITVKELFKDYSQGYLSGLLQASSRKHAYALSNVSFELLRGRSVGIVGRNGSGKSTLLKILSRQLDPTSGMIVSSARVRALIELGTGLDKKLSGAENARFFLRLQGLNRTEVAGKLDQIHDFSELGSAFFDPVETYSSGMFVRLAYSMHAMSEFDVLIIDEALAVGDARFQHKCYSHIQNLKSKGTSIVLVSHSLEQIRQLCERVIVLDGGRVVFDGEVNAGCDKYLKSLFNKERSPLGLPDSSHADGGPQKGLAMHRLQEHPLLFSLDERYGSAPDMIKNVGLMVDGAAATGAVFDSFQEIAIVVSGTLGDYRELMFGFSVKSVEGVIVYATNSYIDDTPISFSPDEAHFQLAMRFNIPLRAGEYFIGIGLCAVDGTTGGEPLDVIPSCLFLEVMTARSKLNDGFLRVQVDYVRQQ